MLALSVAAFHGAPLFGIPMLDGLSAVRLFFMISGFYMTLVLNTKYNNPFPFYWNRSLKIYPAYLVIVFLCQMSDPFPFERLHLLQALYFIWANVAVIGSQFATLVEFHPDGALHLVRSTVSGPGAVPGYAALYIGPVWSLSIELIFYLLAPFLVRIGRGYLVRIGCMIAAAIAFRLATAGLSLPAVPWNYNLLIPNLAFFAIGSLSYWAYFRAGIRERFGLPGLQWSLAVAAVGAILAAPVIPHRLPILVMILALAMPFVFDLTKSSRIDRYIGNLSYPLYVAHFAVINHFPVPVPPAWRIWISLAIAAFLYEFLMKPAEERFRAVPAFRSKAAPLPTEPRRHEDLDASERSSLEEQPTLP